MFAVVWASLLTKPIQYQVAPDHSLVWQGSEYRPVGLWVNGPDAAREAVGLGVRDLVVSLPSDGRGWGPTFEFLDAAGARYLLAVSDPIPQADAVRVEPNYFRVPHLVGRVVLDVSIPGCHSALVTWTTRDVGASPEHRFAKTEGGRLRFEHVFESESSRYTVTAYPATRESGLSDFWDALDDRRDRLVSAFKASPPGPGFRGVIDPLGPGVRFPGESNTCVPQSSAFRSEFSAWLAQQYGSLKFATRSWGLGVNDLRNFDDFAGVVPLWSAGRGEAQVWDPRHDMTYPVTAVGSRVWPDLNLVVRTSASRRFGRIVSTLRRLTGAPVIQSWAGWQGPYETSTELDGIASSPGSSLEPLGSLTHAASSLRRRTFPTWGLNVQDYRGPGTRLLAQQLAETGSSLGFRGLFLRAVADLPGAAAVASAVSAPNGPTHPVLYYPLFSDTLTGRAWREGWWSLPLPVTGRRLDAMGAIDGYAFAGGNDRTAVVWSREGVLPATFRPAEGSAVTVEDMTGKVLKQSTVGQVRVSVGASPLIIRMRGPDPGEERAIQAYTDLLLVLNRRYGAFANPLGGTDIALRQAEQLLGRSPAQATMVLRREAETSSSRVAPFAWLEGVAAQAGSGGVAVPVPGARNDQAWSMDQAFGAEDGVVAVWKTQKSHPLPAEVWVAARVPAGEGEKVEVSVDGHPVGYLTEPVGAYGPGFAWYKLGQVPFGKGGHEVVVRNRALSRGVAVDALLLTPHAFTPDGSRYPFALVEQFLRLGKRS